MTTVLDHVLADGGPGSRSWLPASASLEQVGQAVCGLLNQQGGFVVWGAASRTRPTGFPDAPARASELTRFLTERIKPRPLISVVAHPLAKRTVVVVEVSAGSAKPYRFDRVIWVRLGDRTMRAADNEVRSMVQEAAVRPIPWEAQPVPGLELPDIDEGEVRSARTEIIENGRIAIDHGVGTADLLEKLYLRKDGALLRGASVLFAKDPHAWRTNTEIRLHVFGDKDQTVPASIGRAWTGPCIKVLNQAVSAVKERTMLHARFTPDDLRRKDIPAYPPFVIREALVNAIVHRDYMSSAAIIIDQFADRIEVRNPGRLPEGWSVQDLRRKHLSIPFNPNIAGVFFARGHMDMVGLGAMRMIEECLRAGAKQPVWKAVNNEVRLIIFAAPPPQSVGLSPGHVRIQKALKVGKVLSLGQLARSADVGERQVRRYLAELIEMNLVKRSGSGKSTRYSGSSS